MPQSTVSSTCSNCKSFDRGICQLKAQADWGNSAKVKPTRTACYFAEFHPAIVGSVSLLEAIA